MNDPHRAGDSKRMHDRLTDHHRIGSQRECFQYVRAAANAAVEDQGHAPDPRGDRGERIERAAAMVGDDEPVDAAFQGARGIVRMDDAFEKQRKRRSGPQRRPNVAAGRGGCSAVYLVDRLPMAASTRFIDDGRIELDSNVIAARSTSPASPISRPQ